MKVPAHFLRIFFFLFLSLIITTFFTAQPLLAWDDIAVNVLSGNLLKVKRKGKKVLVRLYGTTCEPLSTVAGMNALRYTSGNVKQRRVKVHPYTMNEQREIEAIVYIQGNNLNELLIRKGLARVDRQTCREWFCTNWLKYEQYAKHQQLEMWSTKQ